MARIFAKPVIFSEITRLKPDLPEPERWEIASQIKEASVAERNYPPGLERRFVAIVAAAERLETSHLPVTVGNLQEQAFTTALQAYRWLWENQLRAAGRETLKKRQITVTASQVREFASRMGIHHNRFRAEGIHSNLCQGSVLHILTEIGQLGDFADHLTSHVKS
ncbi:hypothetical protein A2765_03740 [Candidatus Kaiserbacteria bacterium RIFCSPHIGHO2_01_FULL_56_24]|uniref:Uncharacterized protein n=1 Tax=Candidatus Kaiserbacteria bacterium RIFCSPHIGHO2_01_FULL_56_24 TaxID=1798487 RepID=A0A1F6DGX6_9BACT|nr:MAG: hypothetical protein A2765_03740 [Candidatus Kaiserbacteria bacterium RIFCSPHIGHO2_01_FULL_56_24]